MILEIIILVIGIIILDKFVYKNNMQKENNKMVKSLNLTLLIILNIFLIIYYIDRFDLPSYLNISDGINTQNWLIIITTCISSIISASIGGLIALWVSKDQIKENNKQNYENNRIQNMPLMRYDTSNKISKNIKMETLKSNIEDEVTQQINLSIKNVGLNTARKLRIKIASDILEKEYEFKLSNKEILEKDEEQIIRFLIYLKPNEEYIFNITLYYQDLLFNGYEQSVVLKYQIIPLKSEFPNYVYSYDFEIQDEKLLN